MNTLNSTMALGQIVAERPARAQVFERFGLDYCCGGQAPLAHACDANDVPVDEVLRALAVCDAEAPAEAQDWTRATLTELVEHIQATHHAYLAESLPRLSGLAEKVAGAHGEREPRLRALVPLFEEFRAELELHTLKEDRILFPLIRRLDGATLRPRFSCGTVANPIRVMTAEHDDAGEALSKMRVLTDDFTAHAWACPTYRALLDGLRALEVDMHQHVHKENSILFPRAQAAEDALPPAERPGSAS